jgi:hypothetical protein
MTVMFQTIFTVLFIVLCSYLAARILIADYFRHKEEFWQRIQIKMTKGQHNAEG